MLTCESFKQIKSLSPSNWLTLLKTDLVSEGCQIGLFCGFSLPTLLPHSTPGLSKCIKRYHPVLVFDVLPNVNPSKSHGHDGIQPSFLRIIFSPLHPSVNVRDVWRRATVALLFNKGSPAKASNHIPLIHTSIQCKVFKQVVKDNFSGHNKDGLWLENKQEPYSPQQFNRWLISPSILRWFIARAIFTHYASSLSATRKCHP